MIIDIKYIIWLVMSEYIRQREQPISDAERKEKAVLLFYLFFKMKIHNF